MGFQSTVSTAKSLGAPGDIFNSGPIRAQDFILTSSTDNVVGYAYTVSAQGVATVGGTGVFAGILVNSKAYASYGTAGDTLASTLVVPNNSNGELLKMGTILVDLTTTAAIGDPIYYVNATGALGAGTATTGQTQIPNAYVDYYTVSAAGLAVITLTN